MQEIARLEQQLKEDEETNEELQETFKQAVKKKEEI